MKQMRKAQLKTIQAQKQTQHSKNQKQQST